MRTFIWKLKLKSIFKHSNYPQKFVNQCIKKVLNELFNFMVPKRKLNFVLPYLGNTSLGLRTRLRRTIERDLLYCKLKVILDLSVHVAHCFDLKIHFRKK